jgi:hypothetical protein
MSTEVNRLILAALAALAGQVTTFAAEPLELARDSKSVYTIVHDEKASASVKLAARELQRVLRIATGAELPVAATRPKGPAILVGALEDTAEPAGYDEYTIACVGRDIVIRGRDQETPGKGERWFVPSQGTLYGVFDFLERFVGVRWLMPGDVGEDIPRVGKLSITLAAPIRGRPTFAARSLGLVQEDVIATPRTPRSLVADWLMHQRLAPSVSAAGMHHGHAWDDIIKQKDLAAHPDWRADKGDKTKFCTSQAEAVAFFVDRVNRWLEKRPMALGASISPTDGGGFCQCEECAKLFENDPHGKRSHAAVLLRFYQQVGQGVLAKHPDKRLGAYVYYNYQYPPKEKVELPDNIYLCWAPLNYYGFGLHKPAYRGEFDGVMQRWSKIAPKLVYANHSTWMRSFHGAPLPIPLEILKLELPTAAKHHAWGIRMMGDGAWGVGAAGNYLLARQMWDASIDVENTLDEWFQRAYGPGWRNLRDIYPRLEEAMKRVKLAEPLAYRGEQYEVNFRVMQEVYAPLFPHIEASYRAALEKCVTDAQKRRLEMFGANLVVLHHSLQKAGLLREPEKSMFHRAGDAYAEFLSGIEDSLTLYRDRQGKIYRSPIWKGEWRAPK